MSEETFRAEEATIADVHAAIRAGRTTCVALVRPFSLVFRAEPGREDVVLKIAAAYEAASKRRIPPPRFGPV